MLPNLIRLNFSQVFNFLFHLIEILDEFFKVRIRCALNQKRKWQHFVRVDPNLLVVRAHVYEKTFFVRQLFVVVESPVYLQRLFGVIHVFAKPVYVHFFFPTRPYKVAFVKIFTRPLSPPVSLLHCVLYYLRVVARPDEIPLGLQNDSIFCNWILYDCRILGFSLVDVGTEGFFTGFYFYVVLT